MIKEWRAIGRHEVPMIREASRKRTGRSMKPKKKPKKWSAAVTRSSNALDLESKVFA